ncbi:MAG: Asp23/Gls24 family envelope stress response protein [Eubacteriaceae bacterium]|nr:Asp23/Gls24 family envelope stress response protein [Eubacteriaceae bacterium]
MNNDEKAGNVIVSEEVVSAITNLAAMEIEGVAQMSGSFTGGIAEKLGKKSNTRGVRVVRSEEELVIDLNIIVTFGVNIPKVAQNVQKKVKTTVEAMTGMRVMQVNINVDSVKGKDLSEG